VRCLHLDLVDHLLLLVFPLLYAFFYFLKLTFNLLGVALKPIKKKLNLRASAYSAPPASASSRGSAAGQFRPFYPSVLFGGVLASTSTPCPWTTARGAYDEGLTPHFSTRPGNAVW
jgi:hypothetical protein